MKRYISFFIAFFIITLSACGTEETLDKGEVLNRAVGAAETVESYSVDMNMNIEMMGMENQLVVTGDITHNPDTMYLLMNMGMPGMSMDFEVYAHEEEAYMSMFGEWFVMDTEELGMEDFDQLTEEHMEKFLRFIDDFEMTEEGDNYVLVLSGEGDEYSPLIEDFVQSAMGDFQPDQDLEEMMDLIHVNHLDLELHIDKETFFQTAQIVNADIEIVEQGTNIPMLLEGRFDISNINEIDPIEIPGEVRENAVDEFMDFDPGFPNEEMSLDEIQERTSYQIPTVTDLPEGYTLTESMYEEAMDMVMLNYEKDMENGFMLTITPTENEYNDLFLEEMQDEETVVIQGNDGVIIDMDFFIVLMWEQNDLFIELTGGGPDLTRDKLIQIAENIKFD
ncbi:hypothetical protein J2S74_000351 [Evansella vedderi]|uniref:DUF4367 domain-containing protein n=1 Tax=Evansella vedderi TaxID=38282 RepID=A0ABT9ZP59_9BACI|nr:DUF4367 domain-containing protein [Evansella vedderi]MDQ0252979.1 hypothetical protein [Evansella vedderi]